MPEEIGGDECGDLGPGDESLPLAIREGEQVPGQPYDYGLPDEVLLTPDSFLIAISPAGGDLTIAADSQTMRRVADQLRVVGEARYTAWNPFTKTEATVVFKTREAL